MHRALASLVAAALLTAAPLVTVTHGDTVYAVSYATGELISYDSANPSATRTVLSGSGSFVQAGGLAYGPDGNLYVGEAGDGSSVAPRIARFNLSTQTVSTVYAFNAFEMFPAALAFRGNDLLVGRNPIFGDTGAIMKIADATGGTAAASPYTTGLDLASSPGLALGPDGGLYVSNQTYASGFASGPVVKFDASGVYVGEVIVGGSATGLSGPTGLALSGTTLYTASIMNGAVLQTGLPGNTTLPFGSTGVPFGASPLALLSDGGILAGSAGGAGAIYRFDSAGNLGPTFDSGLGTIGGIAVAPVPEPSTAVLAALGAAGVVGWMRRRRTACPR